jgi:AcrR family transcriptional regulator
VPEPRTSPRRADATRNIAALLDAAAAAFVEAGVEAPVRDIAARAGVGVGTIYRHFPTRADLVVAVYRHQVDALAASADRLLEEAVSPSAALGAWIDGFVDFLVTKHGLAGALRSEDPGLEALHSYFLEELVPACARMLDAARAAHEITADVSAYQLMRAVGNLCIGAESDEQYDARGLVAALLNGLRAGTP